MSSSSRRRPPMTAMNQYAFAMFWSIIVGWFIFVILAICWGEPYHHFGWFSLPTLITAFLGTFAVFFFDDCLLFAVFYLRIFCIMIISIAYSIMLIVLAVKYGYHSTYPIVALVLYICLESTVLFCVHLLCSYGARFGPQSDSGESG